MQRAVVLGIAALTLLPALALASDAGAPLAARVLGAEIRTADAEELRYEVLKRLTDRYAEAHGIAVSEDEKRAYVDSVRAALAADRERERARRAEIERRRAAPDLPESERMPLAKELAQVDELLAALGEPETPTAEERAAREEIAGAFVRQWKIHRALHRQYGGRIVYQQGGPEPLDAIRIFLEERQAAGDFTIVDRELETAFWRYYRDDSIHSFFPPGSREEQEAFASPPWLGSGAHSSPRD